MSDDRRAGFFIVGAPKCGTTAMDYYLSQHPEIFIAPKKETHFFATDLLPVDDPARDPHRYAALFTGMGHEKIAGESSVFYMLSRQAAANIHAYNSAAKIIVHLRNPVDVLASHHSQIVYEGLEPIEDFEVALGAEATRRQNLPAPTRILRVPQVLLYTDVVKFTEQIKRFLDQFGREQVHINVFDDLKADVAGVYRRTLEFLDVDPGFKAEFPIINANKAVRSTAFRRFLKETPDWISAASHLFSSRQTRVRLRRKLKKLNSQPVSRPPMAPELRHRLCRQMAPEVESLSALIGRDLTSWTRQ